MAMGMVMNDKQGQPPSYGQISLQNQQNNTENAPYVPNQGQDPYSEQHQNTQPKGILKIKRNMINFHNDGPSDQGPLPS